MKKKEEKKCCVCGSTEDLYWVTPDKEIDGKYIVKLYCGKHLPD